MASSPEELSELTFTYRELNGMAQIMYLNCICQAAQTLNIEEIDGMMGSDDPELIYLLLLLLKRHEPSVEIEKVICRHLKLMQTSLQAKYCFSEFLNDWKTTISSTFRELLIAYHLEKYLNEQSVMYTQQNAEESQYPILLNRESRSIYKLDVCDIQ